MRKKGWRADALGVVKGGAGGWWTGDGQEVGGGTSLTEEQQVEDAKDGRGKRRNRRQLRYDASLLTKCYEWNTGRSIRKRDHVPTPPPLTPGSKMLQPRHLHHSQTQRQHEYGGRREGGGKGEGDRPRWGIRDTASGKG